MTPDEVNQIKAELRAAADLAFDAAVRLAFREQCDFMGLTNGAIAMLDNFETDYEYEYEPPADEPVPSDETLGDLDDALQDLAALALARLVLYRRAYPSMKGASNA